MSMTCEMTGRTLNVVRWGVRSTAGLDCPGSARWSTTASIATAATAAAWTPRERKSELVFRKFPGFHLVSQWNPLDPLESMRRVESQRTARWSSPTRAHVHTTTPGIHLHHLTAAAWTPREKIRISFPEISGFPLGEPVESTEWNPLDPLEHNIYPKKTSPSLALAVVLGAVRE